MTAEQDGLSAHHSSRGIIERLSDGTGHWIWVRDDPGWDDYLGKIWGENADIGRQLLSAKTKRPHHWFYPTAGSKITHTIVNALTHEKGNVLIKDFSGLPTDRPHPLPNGETMHCKEVLTVVGEPPNDYLRQVTTGGPTPMGEKRHEIVTMKVDENGDYEFAMEEALIGGGVIGKRYFRRFPCYVIFNDTDKKLKLSLYNSMDFLYLISQAKHEVDYGTDCIEATTPETEEEQACFERPDGSRYWVNLKPFCEIVIENENFERRGNLPLCTAKRCA
jgi:hypothetical protein